MTRQYELVERVLSYQPNANEAMLNRAYVYAMKAHGNQKRASGAPYFSHPLEVAAILAEMRLPPNYGQTYTEKFNGTFTELAEQHGIVLLPFLLQEIALEPGMMQEDGIHPTANAQPLILEQVWSALEPLL